jgi:hypothetical protein
MHVASQATFAADPATVARMLADPAYVDAKVRASGALSHEATIDGDASGPFTVTTTRHLPTDAIPAQFRAMIGSSIEVRMVEAWGPPQSDGRDGQMTVEIVGAPVRMTGTAQLRSHAEGSHAEIDGELTASIPLFGAKIEQATAEAISTAVLAEEQVAADWLQRDDA